MVEHGGKLKETNWINIRKWLKQSRFKIEAYEKSMHQSRVLTFWHHMVAAADSRLSFLVRFRFFGQHLFGSIEVRLGGTGLAQDVGLGGHAMLRNLSTCPTSVRPFSSLGMCNDGERWQLLGSAGRSLEPPWPLIKALNLGCPRRSAEFNLSNQNKIAHSVEKDQWKHTLAGIVQVKYVLVILLPWHNRKIWWNCSKAKKITATLIVLQTFTLTPKVVNRFLTQSFPSPSLCLGSVSPQIKTALTSAVSLSRSLSLSLLIIPLENPAAPWTDLWNTWR